MKKMKYRNQISNSFFNVLLFSGLGCFSLFFLVRYTDIPLNSQDILMTPKVYLAVSIIFTGVGLSLLYLSRKIRNAHPSLFRNRKKLILSSVITAVILFASNYLLSPLNTSIPATDFSIYTFIKYKSSDYSSDEGASWFQAQIPGITLETNRIHYIIMAFDIEDLRSQFLPATTTLSRTPWSAPRKIGIKPIKVICN